MSKKAAGAKARDRVPPRKQGAAAADADDAHRRRVAPLPPFKPRRRLFHALLTALALWVGVLLGLYAFTVYPNSHGQADHPAGAAQPDTVSR